MVKAYCIVGVPGGMGVFDNGGGVICKVLGKVTEKPCLLVLATGLIITGGVVGRGEATRRNEFRCNARDLADIYVC